MLGVLGEVDPRVDLAPAVLEQVVERRAALEVLQAVDHREAAVVADHDDQLVPVSTDE